MWQDAICEFETESGFQSCPFTTWGGFSADKSKPILPDSLDVLYSLISDSDVLNHSAFEDWAGELGFDADSRKAESIYRACLEIALKLRAALGDDGVTRLAEIFQDY